MNKPEKEMYLANFGYYNCPEEAEELKSLLLRFYDDKKKEYEIDNGFVWCKFGEPQIIIRSPINDGNPLSLTGTVGIKWIVTGRAFYVIRNFIPKIKHKLHPNKKNVPKKLRGKKVIKKNKNIKND